jgi:hypothetical protein
MTRYLIRDVLGVMDAEMRCISGIWEREGDEPSRCLVIAGLAAASRDRHQAAALTLVGTSEIVFRICEAIW